MLFPVPAAVTALLAPILAVTVNIPVWNQYTALIRWALDLLAQTFHSGGLAIIAFTIIVKTALLPLTVQSIRSSKAMQELQPQIKELQKKHGKDRQRLSAETMVLYQQHRVNPMAGCLPMVIQIPIFLGVYQAIHDLSVSGIGHWNDQFLWIPDLAKPDPIHLLPILAAIFQFVQSRMMRPVNQGKISDPQQAMMNSMMNLMPLTVIMFGWSFSAGPVIYWVTQSVYSVVQQWWITGWGAMLDWFPWLPDLPEHKRLGYRPARPLDEVVVTSADGTVTAKHSGIGGWFNRMMAEAQQQQLRRSGAEPEPEASPVVESARAGGGKGKGGKARNGATAPADAPAAASAGGANGKAVVIPRKSRAE